MSDFMPDRSNNNPLTEGQIAIAATDPTILAMMFKSSEGTGFIDPTYHSQAAACEKHGQPFGAYHYVNGTEGETQAVTFVHSIGGTRPAFLVVDWELEARNVCADLMTRLRKLTKLPVVLYIGSWGTEHGGPPAGTDAIMVAAYTSTVGPYVPAGWGSKLAAWQYTDGSINETDMPASFPGVPAGDVSVIYKPAAFGLDLAPIRYHVGGVSHRFPRRAGLHAGRLAKKAPVGHSVIVHKRRG